MDNLQNDEDKGVLIFDPGGVRNGTITKRAWHVFEYTNHKKKLYGCHYNSKGKVYLIFNAVTKPWITDRDIPVLLVINYETIIDEKEGEIS